MDNALAVEQPTGNVPPGQGVGRLLVGVAVAVAVTDVGSAMAKATHFNHFDVVVIARTTYWLSWKCPGHVPDMSLGQENVLKSQGQKGGPLPTV